MSLADSLRDHLTRTGTSMRALSLEAGLGEKAVADILCGKARRPYATTIAALAKAMGVAPDTLAVPETDVTWAEHLRRLETQPPEDWSSKKCADVLRATTWLVRRMGWVPELERFDRAKARRALDAMTPAEAGLTPSSHATYRSRIGAGLAVGAATSRPRDIGDVSGPWRTIYDRLGHAPFGVHAQWASGRFLAWCDAAGVAPSEVTADTLRDYLADRLARAEKAEARLRRLAGEIRGHWNRLAADPGGRALGCRPLERLAPDKRDRYGVDPAVLASLLREFDQRVAPWMRGERSPGGESYAQVLAAIDAAAPAPADPRKARLKAFVGRQPRHRTEERDAALRAHGILTGRARWGERTLATRRGYVVSLAKALYAATGYEVASMAELTDPEVLEAAAQAIDEARVEEDDEASGYIASVLKSMVKIARDYCGRSADEVDAIRSLVAEHDPGYDGICPRNRAKLQRFTPTRISAFLDLSAVLVGQANAELDRHARAARRRGDRAPARADLVDAGTARLIETAVAHDIMLARPLRLSNLRGIELGDIARDDQGLAAIVIPAARVKGRKRGDAPLRVPLGPQPSRLLDRYVAVVRPKLLAEGDETNRYLFPGRQGDGRAYSGIGRALVAAVHEHVGVRVHPHLYRHLVGWIWLRDDPRQLPSVQRLLGHKRLETTLGFYAELDETLALQSWNEYLNRRKEREDA